MSQLVIIRGNSGSGKSSLAQALQTYYKNACLVVSQDLIRRQCLSEFGQSGTLTISLVEQMAHFGYENDLIVILEGFYEKDKYGDMLERLRTLFGQQTLAFYYDISFEETVRRHQTRDKRHDFTPEDMKRWWRDKDYLEWENEVFITEQMSLEEMTQLIINQLG